MITKIRIKRKDNPGIGPGVWRDSELTFKLVGDRGLIYRVEGKIFDALACEGVRDYPVKVTR